MECVDALLLEDSALILDVEKARSLFSRGFYGLPIGVEKPKDASFETPLRLSVYETLYLAEKGAICLKDLEGRPLNVETLKLTLLKDKKSAAEYTIYKSLRDAGLIVRSGLRYGGDFTVYRIGPGLEHAPFVVNAYEADEEISPLDIVKAQRVSHSARKTLTLAIASKEKLLYYLILRWVKF
ncbi:MAG: tRNA-intron lyase [Acidilobaceae archaeon]